MDEKTLRVSDADRDAAIAELGEHFQAGRLDLADLEDLTGRALRARVGSDLDELLADLPRILRAPGRPQAAARARPVVPFLVPVLVAAALTAAVLIAAVLIAAVSAAAVLIAAVSAAAGTTGAPSGGPCGG